MFSRNEKGQKVFCAGKQDWDLAISAANKCTSFKPDVEEELVTDDERSCYDCRYRRWTAKSFICCKPETID